MQGDNSGGANLTYTIGGANADTEFDGVIKDGNGATVALMKTGDSARSPSPTKSFQRRHDHQRRHAWPVSTTRSATGSGAVMVARGCALAGSGIISGGVTVDSGGRLAPGNPLGRLTIASSLTLAAAGSQFMNASLVG